MYNHKFGYYKKKSTNLRVSSKKKLKMKVITFGNEKLLIGSNMNKKKLFNKREIFN